MINSLEKAIKQDSSATPVWVALLGLVFLLLWKAFKTKPQ